MSFAMQVQDGEAGATPKKQGQPPAQDGFTSPAALGSYKEDTLKQLSQLKSSIVALKFGDIEGISNDRKAALIGAQKETASRLGTLIEKIGSNQDVSGELSFYNSKDTSNTITYLLNYRENLELIWGTFGKDSQMPKSHSEMGGGSFCQSSPKIYRELSREIYSALLDNLNKATITSWNQESFQATYGNSENFRQYVDARCADISRLRDLQGIDVRQFGGNTANAGILEEFYYAITRKDPFEPLAKAETESSNLAKKSTDYLAGVFKFGLETIRNNQLLYAPDVSARQTGSIEETGAAAKQENIFFKSPEENDKQLFQRDATGIPRQSGGEAIVRVEKPTSKETLPIFEQIYDTHSIELAVEDAKGRKSADYLTPYLKLLSNAENIVGDYAKQVASVSETAKTDAYAAMEQAKKFSAGCEFVLAAASFMAGPVGAVAMGLMIGEGAIDEARAISNEISQGRSGKEIVSAHAASIGLYLYMGATRLPSVRAALSKAPHLRLVIPSYFAYDLTKSLVDIKKQGAELDEAAMSGKISEGEARLAKLDLLKGTFTTAAFFAHTLKGLPKEAMASMESARASLRNAYENMTAKPAGDLQLVQLASGKVGEVAPAARILYEYLNKSKNIGELNQRARELTNPDRVIQITEGIETREMAPTRLVPVTGIVTVEKRVSPLSTLLAGREVNTIPETAVRTSMGEKTISTIASLSKTVSNLVEAGEVHLRAGRSKEAKESFFLAARTATTPQEKASALAQAGEACINAGKLEDARKWFNLAIGEKIAPQEKASLLAKAGEACLQVHQFKEAGSWFFSAAAFEPAGSQRRAVFFTKQGETHQLAGDFKSAGDAYLEACKLGGAGVQELAQKAEACFEKTGNLEKMRLSAVFVAHDAKDFKTMSSYYEKYCEPINQLTEPQKRELFKAWWSVELKDGADYLARNLSIISQLEKLQPGAFKALHEKNGISHFDRYFTGSSLRSIARTEGASGFAQLISQYEKMGKVEFDANGKEKPLFVVLFPQSDHNTAFRLHGENINSLSESFDVRIIEAGTKASAARRLLGLNESFGKNYSLGNYRPISKMLIGAHGQPNAFFLPEKVTAADLARSNFAKLFIANPEIILLSCSTGRSRNPFSRYKEVPNPFIKGGKIEIPTSMNLNALFKPSLAHSLSRAYPKATIQAPRTPSNISIANGIKYDPAKDAMNLVWDDNAGNTFSSGKLLKKINPSTISKLKVQENVVPAKNTAAGTDFQRNLSALEYGSSHAIKSKSIFPIFGRKRAGGASEKITGQDVLKTLDKKFKKQVQTYEKMGAFDKAGNMYRNAADNTNIHAEKYALLSKAAESYEKSGNFEEAGNMFRNAASNIHDHAKQVFYSKAIEYYSKAAENYEKMGAFDKAGNMYSYATSVPQFDQAQKQAFYSKAEENFVKTKNFTAASNVYFFAINNTSNLAQKQAFHSKAIEYRSKAFENREKMKKLEETNDTYRLSVDNTSNSAQKTEMHKNYLRVLRADEAAKMELASAPDFSNGNMSIADARNAIKNKAIECRKKTLNLIDDVEALYKPMLSERKDMASMFESFRSKAFEIEHRTNVELREVYEWQNVSRCKEIFMDNISSFRPEFSEKIQGQIFGYLMKVAQNAEKLTSEAKTYNELTNIIHRFATELLPGYAPENSLFKPRPNISSLGEVSAQFNSVLDGLSNVSSKTIFAVQNGNELMVQIRDYGHATTLNITADPSGSFNVNYFIPKAYGEQFVKNLPGFTSYSHDAGFKFAKGSFTIEPGKNVAKEIWFFVEKIPTDAML